MLEYIDLTTDAVVLAAIAVYLWRRKGRVPAFFRVLRKKWNAR